jgi:hypothetical protein
MPLVGRILIVKFFTHLRIRKIVRFKLLKQIARFTSLFFVLMQRHIEHILCHALIAWRAHLIAPAVFAPRRINALVVNVG